MSGNLTLSLPFTAFNRDSYQRTLRDIEAWAGLMGRQSVVDFSFGATNLAASLTNSQLYRAIGGGGGAVARQMGIVMPWDAGAVGMGVVGNSAVSAGSATFTVFSNGVIVSAYQLVWSGGTSAQATFDPEATVLGAGSKIDVRVTTTGSFAPTPDVEAVLYVVKFS